MATKLFVNLPVRDLARSREFFADLGFDLFGAGADMASVVISEYTQVMLLAESTFAGYARNVVADANMSTQAILVVGLDSPAQVDDLVEKAIAAGGSAIGAAQEGPYRYQRGFADLDGHHWEALSLVAPAPGS